MDRPVILVMATAIRPEIGNAVFDEGSIPLLTRELTEFVEKLRRNFVAAVVVDSEHTGTDALEIVLTARDINPEVPILILGTSLDSASVSALQHYSDIRLLPKNEQPLKLYSELARLARPV